MKKFILSSVLLVSFAASAAEVTKDWKIVYPDGAAGADPCVDYALRVLANVMIERQLPGHCRMSVRMVK